MESSARSVLVLAAALVLVSCQPADAWYKQATGPSYYSVGRASGLLSGIRRSPHARRAESETGTAETDTQPASDQELHALSQRLPPALRNMLLEKLERVLLQRGAGGSETLHQTKNSPRMVLTVRKRTFLGSQRFQVVCVKEISPNLQSCELAMDGSSAFRCKADVLLALDALECAGA